MLSSRRPRRPPWPPSGLHHEGRPLSRLHRPRERLLVCQNLGTSRAGEQDLICIAERCSGACSVSSDGRAHQAGHHRARTSVQGDETPPRTRLPLYKVHRPHRDVGERPTCLRSVSGSPEMVWAGPRKDSSSSPPSCESASPWLPICSADPPARPKDRPTLAHRRKHTI